MTRIVAEYIPQQFDESNNNNILYLPVPDDNEWDVTEEVLRMTPQDIRDMRDDQDSSDALAELPHAPRCVTTHDGPYVVRVRRSIEAYVQIHLGKPLHEATDEELLRLQANFEQFGEVLAVYNESGYTEIDTIIDMQRRKEGGIQPRLVRTENNPTLVPGQLVSLRGGTMASGIHDRIIVNGRATELVDDKVVSEVKAALSKDYLFQDTDLEKYFK